MKKLLAAAAAVMTTLVFATAASAALDAGVYDPANTGCPKATYAKGVLHLEKNCATATDAAAGAEITGLAGQSFQSAEFTLATASQCQGGSPRFLVVTDTAPNFYPLGCNNVTPTTNGNGTVTYVFDATTVSPSSGVTMPVGKITGVYLILDVQGSADVSKIRVNGVKQKPAHPGKADLAKPCKKDGWKNFTNPKFKNQGQCVKYMVHARKAAKKAEHEGEKG